MTKTYFADDIIDLAVPAELELLNIRQPLVVSGPAEAEYGHVDRVVDAMDAASRPAVSLDARGPTSEAAINVIAQQFRHNGCDGLVAIGGDEIIDAAKAAAFSMSHPELLKANRTGAADWKATRDFTPPVIAIPTIPGAGAEVSARVIIQKAPGKMFNLSNPGLMPRAVIYDPTLTLALSPLLTASSGMATLSLAIESLAATGFNPPADGMAVEAITRAHQSIRPAVRNGMDLNARRNMMTAAMCAALAAHKGQGGIEAATRALSCIHGEGFHHGELRAILMPTLLRFNAPAMNNCLAVLKRAFDLRPNEDIAEKIALLARKLGLRGQLRDLLFDESHIAAAAALAEQMPDTGTNPRLVTLYHYGKLMAEAL